MADEIRLRFIVKAGDAAAGARPKVAARGGVDEDGETLDTCRRLLGQAHGEFGAEEHSDEGPVLWFTIPCRKVRERNPAAARDNAAA